MTHTQQIILKRLKTTLRVWIAGIAAGNDDAFAMVERIESRIRRLEAAK